MIFGGDFPPLLISFIFMISLEAIFIILFFDNFVDVIIYYRDRLEVLIDEFIIILIYASSTVQPTLTANIAPILF